MTLVMKFGGTSVGSTEAMQSTTELILRTRHERGPVVIVASAMGSKPVKVTDLLLNGAHTAVKGDGETYKRLATQLRAIHREAIEGLIPAGATRTALITENNTFIDRFESLCQAVAVLGELTPRALDAISGMGEQMSIRILAAYLRQIGHPAEAIDATELIVTDDNFQAATPLWAETTAQVQARLRPLLDDGVIPIVTGFIGATEDGRTTTLGRGGSDFSGAILGKTLSAEEVWIWTDVDGVMTADPRMVENAQTIPVLSYREVAELAYYGAKVLHPKTMRPCVEEDIPLRIKNTFNPSHPGTVIVRSNPDGRKAMKAVTAIKDLSMITVEGKGMMGVPGIAARTFGAVAREDVSVLLITQASSEQSICLVVPAGSTSNVTQAIETEFAEELARRDIDQVWAIRPVSIVTVVGADMRNIPGVAGQIFTALGQHNVNVLAIAQGSSECGISLVVAGDDTTAAVQHIHTLL